MNDNAGAAPEMSERAAATLAALRDGMRADQDPRHLDMDVAATFARDDDLFDALCRFRAEVKPGAAPVAEGAPSVSGAIAVVDRRIEMLEVLRLDALRRDPSDQYGYATVMGDIQHNLRAVRAEAFAAAPPQGEPPRYEPLARMLRECIEETRSFVGHNRDAAIVEVQCRRAIAVMEDVAERLEYRAFAAPAQDEPPAYSWEQRAKDAEESMDEASAKLIPLLAGHPDDFGVDDLGPFYVVRKPTDHPDYKGRHDTSLDHVVDAIVERYGTDGEQSKARESRSHRERVDAVVAAIESHYGGEVSDHLYQEIDSAMEVDDAPAPAERPAALGEDATGTAFTAWTQATGTAVQPAGSCTDMLNAIELLEDIEASNAVFDATKNWQRARSVRKFLLTLPAGTDDGRK